MSTWTRPNTMFGSLTSAPPGGKDDVESDDENKEFSLETTMDDAVNAMTATNGDSSQQPTGDVNVLRLFDDQFIMSNESGLANRGFERKLTRMRRHFGMVAWIQFFIGIGSLTWAAVYDPNLRYELVDDMYSSKSTSILDPQQFSFGTVRIHYMVASLGLVTFFIFALAAVSKRVVGDGLLIVWLSNGINPIQWAAIIYSIGSSFAILAVLSGIYRFFTVLLLHASGLLSLAWFCTELIPTNFMAKHAYTTGLTAHLFPWLVIFMSHFSAINVISAYRVVLLWTQVFVDVLLYSMVRRHNVYLKKPIPGASLLKIKGGHQSDRVTSRLVLPSIDYKKEVEGSTEAESYCRVLERNLAFSMFYCFWTVLKTLSMSAIVIAGASLDNGN